MKENNMCGKIYRVIPLLIFIFIQYGCDRSRNTPGWDYFPDMFYSTAYETFTKNPNFADGMTMRVPVPGTVPREFTPFNYTIDPDSRIRAGIELVNPVSTTEESISRGKEVYSTFCLVCHGVKGVGDGTLYQSGLYPLEPRNLTDDASKDLKDGELFHSITLGYGAMGAHGSQIRAADRWKLVLYIRKLQEEALATSDAEQGNK